MTPLKVIIQKAIMEYTDRESQYQHIIAQVGLKRGEIITRAEAKRLFFAFIYYADNVELNRLLNESLNRISEEDFVV